jgi:hypothetical protein
VNKHILNIKQQALVMGLLFCLMCLSFNAKGFLPPDSVSVSYPIDDPRNPACPCHQYQKIADEEYRQLLASNAKYNLTELNNTGTHELKDVHLTETNVVYSKKQQRRKHKFFFSYRKTSFTKHRKKKQHKRIMIRFKSIDDCFRF